LSAWTSLALQSLKMAPGPTPLVQKPQAQRYRRGKLPSGAPIPSDDSSDEEEEQQQQPARGANRSYVDDDRQGLVSGGAGRIITSASDLVSSVKAGSGTGKRGIQVALRDVKVEEDGALLIGGKREVGRTEMEGEFQVWGSKDGTDCGH
jgi:microfibrillar-associated protein 1